MANKITEIFDARIKQEIVRYHNEVLKVRQIIGPQYKAAGCITIYNPGSKMDGIVMSDTEGLELSYDAKDEKTFWHLDRTKRVWTFEDMEKLRQSSSYRPPEHQKELAGNANEYEYSPQKIRDLGKKILSGQKVGPLEHELLVDIPQTVSQEIGVHMYALGKYLIDDRK